MMGLFKKAKAAPPPSETIRKLRDTLEQLEKREQHLDNKIKSELEKAKQNVGTNKRVALMALKRKKAYEAQIDKMIGARTTLETQIIAIESASTNLVVLDAIKEGGYVLHNINRQMTIDQVENTMDEIQDQMTVANEIAEAIAMPIGNETFDDDELNAELEQLQVEAMGNQIDKIDKGDLDLHLPSVSSSAPKVMSQQESPDPWKSLQMEMEI